VSAVIADFNHDGKPDVATAGDNGVAILLNNGNGFAPPVIYATAAATSLAVADVRCTCCSAMATARSKRR